MRISVQLLISAMSNRDSIFSAGSKIKGKTRKWVLWNRTKWSSMVVTHRVRGGAALSTIKIVDMCDQCEGRCVRFEAQRMNIARTHRDVILGRKRA